MSCKPEPKVRRNEELLLSSPRDWVSASGLREPLGTKKEDKKTRKKRKKEKQPEYEFEIYGSGKRME